MGKPLTEFCFPNKPYQFFDINQLSIDMAVWIVQPKWDGHRAMPYCDKDGKVTVNCRKGKPLHLAQNNFTWLSMLDLPRPWGLDCELTRDGRMIAWDFWLLDGKLRFNEPYINRLTELQSIVKKVSKDVNSFELIETLPASKYRNFVIRQGELGLEGYVLKNPNSTTMFGPFKTNKTSSQFKYRF